MIKPKTRVASRAAGRKTTGQPRTRMAGRCLGAAGQSTRSLSHGLGSTSPELRSRCSPWQWHLSGAQSG